MRLNAPSARYRLVSLFCLLACCAPAMSLAEEVGPTEPLVDLDLECLVFEPDRAKLADKVWQPAAQPGRRLVLLPLRVNPVKEPTELSRSPIKVRAGRFIAYQIPAPDRSAAGDDRRLDINAIMTADPEALARLLAGVKADEPPAAEPTEGQGEDQSVPEGAPRLARSVTLHPDGTIEWEMDRNISGAELSAGSETNLYPLKLDPKQMRSREPERGERITRNEGEDSRAFALRKREAQKQEREKVKAYRDLREAVRALPETFREKTPAVIYAVYDTGSVDAIEIAGPAPLPWTLSDEDQSRFRSLEQAAPGNEQGDALFNALAEQVTDDAIVARVAAIGVYRSGLAAKVQADDAGYKLISKLVASKDPVARRTAMVAAARTVPPTLASAQLLQAASESIVGAARREVQFASLTKLLGLRADGDAQRAALLAEKTSRLIADPQGPGALRVIDALLASTSVAQNSNQMPLSPEAQQVLIEKVDFSEIANDQLEPVLKRVITASPEHPVASGWLGTKLLGQDSGMTKATLALLAAAVRAEPDPGTDGQSAEQAAEPDDAFEVSAPPAAVQGAVVLGGTIPIDSLEHGLVVLLEADEEEVRGLAWVALKHFDIRLVGEAAQASEAGALPPGVGLLDQVLALAMRQANTPPSLIDFINNQSSPTIKPLASARFIGLLAQPGISAEVAEMIAGHVLSAEGRYNADLRGLDAETRTLVVMTMYAASKRVPPLTVGMLERPGDELMPWLTGQFSKGELPMDEQWVEALGNEQRLIAYAADSVEGSARGGAAGLALWMGGNRLEQQTFAERVAAIDPRDEQAVTEAWMTYKSEIVARALKEATGTYRLTVSVYKDFQAIPQQKAGAPTGKKIAGGEDDKPVEPAEKIDLGLLQLTGVGTSVTLSVEGVALSPSPDRLGIRIDQPASLRAFENPSLSQWPLDRLDDPIDLRPSQGGVWSGRAKLPGGAGLVVSFEPQQP